MRNEYLILDEIFNYDDNITQPEIRDEDSVRGFHTSLFKIPKYFETYIFFGISMLLNAIIFNLIILPLKLIVMIFRSIFCSNKTNNNIQKMKIYLLKIFMLLFGLFIKKILEKSFPIFLMHHKLRSLSGMKILTFIRVIEVFNNLLNKFNRDNDVQLISIINQSKLKKKIISISILLLSMCLNIFTFWSYMISLSIVLNDPNNFIYPLFLKLNYIDMKKTGKSQSKKKILNVLFYEVYDRFFVFLALLLVILNNYTENKINSHNFVDYTYRVLFLVITEIVFDWIKISIIFKISCIKPSWIKQVTMELATFHEKLKNKSYESNGMNQNCKNYYAKHLESEKLIIINQDEIHKYNYYLDNDNIICVQLQTNIMIYCIIVLSLIYDKLLIHYFKLILIVLILLYIRKILHVSLTNYILDRIIRQNYPQIQNNSNNLKSKNSNDSIISSKNGSENSVTSEDHDM